MCQFFSTIYTRQGDIYFTEEDSHDTIISRKRLRDNSLFLRSWVRVEYVDHSLKLDETSCPSWFDRVEAEERVRKVYKRVSAAHKAYNAAKASAREAYEAARAPAQEAYDAAIASAQEAYKAATASAAIAPAREAYNAARASAREAYIKKISSITGYVPPR